MQYQYMNFFNRQLTVPSQSPRLDSIATTSYPTLVNGSVRTIDTVINQIQRFSIELTDYSTRSKNQFAIIGDQSQQSIQRFEENFQKGKDAFVNLSDIGQSRVDQLPNSTIAIISLTLGLLCLLIATILLIVFIIDKCYRYRQSKKNSTMMIPVKQFGNGESAMFI